MAAILPYQKEFLKRLVVNIYKLENKNNKLNNYRKFKLALSSSKDNISKYDVIYSIQMAGPDNNCYGDHINPLFTFGANLNKCDYGRLTFNQGYKGHDELLTKHGKLYAKQIIRNSNN